MNSGVTFGARLPSQPGRARVATLAFLSQRPGAYDNAGLARRTSFAFISLEARLAWEPWVP